MKSCELNSNKKSGVNMNKKVKEILRHPLHLFLTFGHRGLFNWMSDELYIKIAHKIKLGEKLDLEHPQTYNQKLQWLKLYDRNPIYSSLADKYDVRGFISEVIGEDYLIPLISSWNNVNEIDFESLPNQFVLKCTHDSGGIVICKDKSHFNISKAKKKLKKSMKHNFYWGQREWIYKDIHPRIVAEKYMEDKETNELRDYKFFCFNGVVKALFIASDRGQDTRFDFFDTKFNHMPLKQYYPNANKEIKKPINFNKMISIAEVLSKGIPHVRVDLYEINGKVYFGEMTFFHFSGWKKFDPHYYDELFGSWLKLPQ